MKHLVLLLTSVVCAYGCQVNPTSSTTLGANGYNKTIGFETDSDSMAGQLYAVLQRYAYTKEGGNLAPFFRRDVDSDRGIESYSILSADEGIRCDKITSLAGSGYLCEFSLESANLASSTNEKSIPAILYKALANVRGEGVKALVDYRTGDHIGCALDKSHGYRCELNLPHATEPGANGPDQPRLPEEKPADEPIPGDIPVLN